MNGSHKITTSYNGCDDTKQSFAQQRRQAQAEEAQASNEQLIRVLASQKNYTGASIIVFLLYWFFWIPGLLVNILYLNEAEQVKKASGRSPVGIGCLYLMFFVGIAPLFFLIGSCISLSANVASDKYGGSIDPTPQARIITPTSSPPPTPQPTPILTPPLTSTPELIIADPEVVTSENAFREGVAFQLKSDQEIILPTGSIQVPREAWIRIDSIRRNSSGMILEVEARYSDGRFIGAGIMRYQQ